MDIYNVEPSNKINLIEDTHVNGTMNLNISKTVHVNVLKQNYKKYKCECKQLGRQKTI